MLKRARWMGIGAVAGAAGTVWSQRTWRRQVERLTPDNVVAAARDAATHVVHQGAGRVKEAFAAALVARDGRADPSRGPRADSIDLRSDAAQVPAGRFRPANWDDRRL